MQNTELKKRGRPARPELRQQREEQILAAATRLFAEHGFAAANTQVLAEQLGVGKGTIFRYFPTKESLFLAAVDRGMRKLKTSVDRAVEGIDDPMEMMSRGMQAYFAFFNDRPDLVELLIQERAQFKDRPKPTYFIHREANTERWRDLFRGLIAQGRVRQIPVERITEVLGDLLYGTMFANYFTRRQRSPEEQAADILDITLNGILAPGENRTAEETWQS